jgi:hypothetical protein
LSGSSVHAPPGRSEWTPGHPGEPFQALLAIERRRHELVEALETNGDLLSTAAHRSSGATSALSVQ